MAQQRRQQRPRRKDENEFSAVDWAPKTKLGKLVYDGKITTMSEALASRYMLKEPEIVDILLPELEDEVLDVNMVQRMTDSGRRVRFAITAIVGNGDGFVGIGRTKGKEVGPAIRRAIDVAKVNIIEVKRGCGSWECGCLKPHTIPFSVTGKSGSVKATFNPAPQGVGLAVADVPKKILKLAGIKDAWDTSKGHTKTTVNYSFATFNALKQTTMVKVTPKQATNLKIITGPVDTVFLETSPSDTKRAMEEKKAKDAEAAKKREQELADKKSKKTDPEVDTIKGGRK